MHRLTRLLILLHLTYLLLPTIACTRWLDFDSPESEFELYSCCLNKQAAENTEQPPEILLSLLAKSLMKGFRPHTDRSRFAALILLRLDV